MGAESQEERERYFREQEKKRNKEAWEWHYKEMSRMDKEERERNSKPSPSSSSCFVATVAFGDPNCWELNTLRDYRDNTLSKTRVGQKFIEWYYENGEQLAAWIDKRPTIKRITKRVLEFIVKHLK